MKRNVRFSALTLILTIIGTVPCLAGYKVIVHAQNDQASLERAQVAKVFMKKISNWPDGTSVVVVDQKSQSVARQDFSEEVLGLSVSRVRSYWQKLTYSGRGTPPDELKSDQEVIEFVAANEGAVGYVSADTPLNDSVRILPVE